MLFFISKRHYQNIIDPTCLIKISNQIFYQIFFGDIISFLDNYSWAYPCKQDEISNKQIFLYLNHIYFSEFFICLPFSLSLNSKDFFSSIHALKITLANLNDQNLRKILEFCISTYKNLNPLHGSLMRFFKI